MRKMIALLATVASLAYAAPSHAAGGGFSGYYLATFKVPGGSFQHCFQLSQANGTVPGYKISGTWVDTDFAGTAGQFAVYAGTLHLAGYVSNPDETDNLTIDGKISAGKISQATFDLFSQSGMYLSLGSLTEMRDPACKISD